MSAVPVPASAGERAHPWVPVHVERGLVRLKERLRARFGARLAELTLFGSFARGEQHGESDVDVLVLFEGELCSAEEQALFDDVAAVDVEAGIWISPFVCSRARFGRLRDGEIRIALDIESEGIPV